MNSESTQQVDIEDVYKLEFDSFDSRSGRCTKICLEVWGTYA